MQVIINTSTDNVLDWGATGENRIIQNIFSLLKTYKYEIAYDRTLGLTGKFIDKPLDQAVAIAIAEIYELISLREPRTKIINVQHIGIDNDGNMQFKVVIDIE